MCPACYQRNRIDSQTIITHDCLHLDSYNILRKASLAGDRNETLEQLFQSITSTSPLKSEIPTVTNYSQFGLKRLGLKRLFGLKRHFFFETPTKNAILN